MSGSGVPTEVRAPFVGAHYSFRQRLARWLWSGVESSLFRFSPRPFHAWRAWLLRRFGARLGEGTRVYPGARIWAPWNLQTGRLVAIADGVEVYNPALVELGDYTIISQGAYLCAASHDYVLWRFPIVAKPIRAGEHVWVAARAVVLMGVELGPGCVVGCGSVVSRDLPGWSVCAGNPCVVLKRYEKRAD